MQLMVKDRAKPSPAGVKVERIVITPDIAKAWLDKNTHNRRLNHGIAHKYARDMRSGAWQVTGDAIRFDINSVLIDGQHRLQGCVLADVAFETFVIYGLPPETQNVIDVGKVRSTGDMFALMGLHNTTVLSGALRVLLAEKAEARPRSITLTHTQVREAYERHPLITRYLPTGGMLPKGISGAQVGFLRYVGAEILRDPVTTQAAFEVLRFGVPAYQGDPIHAYRERIIKMGDAKSLALSKDSRWWTLKAAFNMFRKHETATHMRFGRDNPAIDGLDLGKL